MKEFLRRAQFPLLITLGTMPIAPLGLGLADPALMRWSWCLPLAFLAVCLGALAVPGKVRMAFGIAGCAVIAGLGILLGCWQAWVVAAVYCAMVLWSLRIASWPREREIPGMWLYASLFVQLGAQMVLVASRNVGNNLDAAAPWIMVSFLGFVLLTMLSLNRAALASASMGRHKASRSMRAKNVMLILVLVAVAVLISLTPMLARLLGQLGVLAREFMEWFMGLFEGRYYGESVPTEATEPVGPMAPAGKPNPIALFLETVFSLIAQGAVIAVIVFLLWKAAKGVLRLCRKLLEKLNRYSAAVGEDYEDEITDTRLDNDRHTAAGLPSLKRENLSGLAPAQRIRREYRNLLRRHRLWTEASTARENLPEEMASLYERARYARSQMTEEEASRFRTGTKEL